MKMKKSWWERKENIGMENDEEVSNEEGKDEIV